MPIAVLLMTALLLAPSAGAVPAPAATSPERMPSPSIADFAWLAGTWRGTGLGGECEETWSAPFAGEMTGTFRLLRDSETVFYEFMLLEADAEGFALKLKHFSADFTAWEEKADHVRFPLDAVEPNRAAFRGLTIERKGERLTVRVRLQREGEEARWESFDLQQVDPAAD